MSLLSLIAFTTVTVIAVATPGPTVLLALANGSRFGVRRALFGMGGAVASDIVLVGAVSLGLGALLAASEIAFTVVKWVGVAYLAFIGVRLLLSKGGLTLPDANGAARSDRAIFLKSFLVAVTNPKGYLFCTAFLPQFIDPSAALAPQYATLCVIFCLVDFAIMLAYAAAGSKAVKLLKHKGALWIERACGGALLALAGSLAFYRRAS
ncbi:MAG TPA: LysE family translocator [Magnetospirillaceae bacterium]|nr:LysE family translocator [Magnetospirillaceae bacterium]